MPIEIIHFINICTFDSIFIILLHVMSNKHVFPTKELISLNLIGEQLLSYDFQLMALIDEKKHSKNLTQKKQLAEKIKILNLKYKTLKSYLNSRAKFVSK